MLVDMPSTFIWRPGKFELSYAQLRGSTWGKKVQVINVADDKWIMRYETRPLREPEAATVESFFDALNGGMNLFRGWSPLREYPRAYPSGFSGLTVSGQPWTGVANLASVGSGLDAVTLNGLPSGYKISTGDMLSFAYGSDGQTLHRALADVTASGGSATISVAPLVPHGVATGVAVQMSRAWCKAGVKAETIQRQQMLGRLISFTFDAEQVD